MGHRSPRVIPWKLADTPHPKPPPGQLRRKPVPSHDRYLRFPTLASGTSGGLQSPASSQSIEPVPGGRDRSRGAHQGYSRIASTNGSTRYSGVSPHFRSTPHENVHPCPPVALQERESYCAGRRGSALKFCRRLRHPRRVLHKAEPIERSNDACGLTSTQTRLLLRRSL